MHCLVEKQSRKNISWYKKNNLLQIEDFFFREKEERGPTGWRKGSAIPAFTYFCEAPIT